jgi:hypothetical protein
MDWSALPAWGALLLAAGAGWVSWLARSDSKRAADAAQEAVELQRAEAAAARDAVVAAEAALELQRAEAARQRAHAEERRRAAAPRPELVVEAQSRNGTYYRVHNIGTASVSKLVLKDPEDNVVAEVQFLGPRAAKEFQMGRWGMDRWLWLHASWHESSEGVRLYVQPKGSVR